MKLQKLMAWINHSCTNKKGIAERWCKLVGKKEGSFYSKADQTNNKYNFKEGKEIDSLVIVFNQFQSEIS